MIRRERKTWSGHSLEELLAECLHDLELLLAQNVSRLVPQLLESLPRLLPIPSVRTTKSRDLTTNFFFKPIIRVYSLTRKV
jgi:hypothetical protein